jgi:hypothetical protein
LADEALRIWGCRNGGNYLKKLTDRSLASLSG